MKYASFKMWIADKYHYKEGYAIWLVVRKNNKRKVMALGIYAEPHQWDDKQEMFITDKRVPKLHPDRNIPQRMVNAKEIGNTSHYSRFRFQ